ncbi:MAG TPA: SRPBCC family protein [Pseudomonadales bacterium]|nr:SRPBCC family protein [Pseudomonadales bacterium]
MNTDEIKKTIVLKASRQKVWDAVSDSTSFGAWFGVEFDGPFVAGSPALGRSVPTQVDPEVAKLQEPHRGTPFEIHVERIEPMRLFSFRWHPYAVDADRDYAGEPMTLVSFELADADEGILLTITESGFDRLPPERRTQAWKSNEGGWTHQTKLIQKYLAQQG